MNVSIQDKLVEIYQAAEEIESASDASLSCCGFDNEDERAEFIKGHAADIIKLAALLLEYKEGVKKDAGSIQV